MDATTVSTVSTAMVTALTTVANSALSGIADIVPVAAPVLGATMVVGIIIRAFRKVAGKS